MMRAREKKKKILRGRSNSSGETFLLCLLLWICVSGVITKHPEVVGWSSIFGIQVPGWLVLPVGSKAWRKRYTNQILSLRTITTY